VDLSKFKEYELMPGIATVTIAKHGLGFSKKAIYELGSPDYVRLLINNSDKQLALVVASEGESGAIKCMAGRNPEDTRNFRIGSKDLLHKIAYMMNWPYEEMNFKIVGEFFDDETVMLIDLHRAKKIDKNTDSDESDENDEDM